MKRILRLTALLLAAALLGGCAVLEEAPAEESSAQPGTADYGQNMQDWYSQWMRPETTRTDYQRTYGSAGLLAWPTALVSVYLSEEDGAQWTEDMIAESRESLAVAVDWITEQAADYGVNTKIYYDDGTPNSGLYYNETCDWTFIGGEDSDEGDDFNAAADALCAELDTDALHQKYGTSSVGFLLFLPVEGSAYTMVHYQEDDTDYYYEYCCLYAYDAYSDPGTFDGPAVYAHEILHQYGAPDLYDGSSDYYVTDELLEYVEENWPDAIMYYTYEDDDSIRYGSISKTLCPITAYRLGFCTSVEELDEFPDIAGTSPGTFVMEEPETPKSGGKIWDLVQGYSVAV